MKQHSNEHYTRVLAVSRFYQTMCILYSSGKQLTDVEHGEQLGVADVLQLSLTQLLHALHVGSLPRIQLDGLDACIIQQTV